MTKKIVGKNKIFPIKTDTSCRLKWSWSTLYLNTGKTASCHRAALCDIPENFEDFHNTPLKIKHREMMLDGQWPGNGCEYCKQIEEAGGTSDRIFQNQIPGSYPFELETDPTQTKVTPNILEVFFANTCNLKCVYCSPKYSSAIQAENAAHGGAILAHDNFEYSDNQYKTVIPEFWKWFEQHGTDLQRFHVLGGEPFLQKDMQVLIDSMTDKRYNRLEFNLVTNLAAPPAVIRPQLDKLSKLHVKRFDIQVSIDSWDKSQEYIRHGLDLSVFDDNLNYMLDQNKYRIGLLSTVTSLSIFGLPALAKKYLEWSQKQKVYWYMHLVVPVESIFCPTIFDYKVFEESIEQTRASIPKDVWDDEKFLDIFNGIVLKLKSRCSNNIDKQKQLLHFLETTDARRGTNWQEQFPWLVTVFKENNVVQ